MYNFSTEKKQILTRYKRLTTIRYEKIIKCWKLCKMWILVIFIEVVRAFEPYFILSCSWFAHSTMAGFN